MCLHPLNLGVSICLYSYLELLGLHRQPIGNECLDQPSRGGQQCHIHAQGRDYVLPVDSHRNCPSPTAKHNTIRAPGTATNLLSDESASAAAPGAAVYQTSRAPCRYSLGTWRTRSRASWHTRPTSIT